MADRAQEILQAATARTQTQPSVLESAVYGPIEKVLDVFGLMRGPGAPAKRFAVGATAVGLALWALKPKLMFVGDQPRPFSFTSNDPLQTQFPWWAGALAGGVFLGFLI